MSVVISGCFKQGERKKLGGCSACIPTHISLHSGGGLVLCTHLLTPVGVEVTYTIFVHEA